MAHLLPEQAPMHAFVHHNTLHMLEHVPFERAVAEGARIYGTEPYPTEALFTRWLRQGRIPQEDIDAVILPQSKSDEIPLFEGGSSRVDFRRARVRHLFEIPSPRSIDWLRDETELLVRFDERVSSAARKGLELDIARGSEDSSPSSHTERRGAMLRSVWSRLEAAAQVVVKKRESDKPARPVRMRHRLLATTGIDTDLVVHPFLLRFTAAFVDQGVAYWAMPSRERGMLRAFRELYGLAAAPPDAAFCGLDDELRRQDALGWDAEQTIRWALGELGHAPSEWEAAIRDTLLSLRGWAGMVYQLQARPDRAPVAPSTCRLEDYLAVQLTLDVVAARNTLKQHVDADVANASMPSIQRAANSDGPEAMSATMLDAAIQLTYESFLSAQVAGTGLSALDNDTSALIWVQEVADFGHFERRQALHAAYERGHLRSVLDGLAARAEIPNPAAHDPAFQAVFCIDDREESIRRHLEERFPAVETFAAAGFFGVPMSYVGINDLRPRPLCPVTIRPKHLVTERAVDDQAGASYRLARHEQARRHRAWNVSTATLARGGMVTAAAGIVSMVPLVARSLFPKAANKLDRVTDRDTSPRPLTRLAVFRNEPDPCQATPIRTSPPHMLGAEGLIEGFTIEESANIVVSLLQSMGMVKFSRLVFLVGHGSASKNNPHKAAYDCGATGGGKGGSNARAFAVMANEPAVRAIVRQRGIDIPDSAHFVGGYHSTSDDAMEFYDEDLVPASHRAAYDEAKRAFDLSCRWDAHERVRRFETAALDLEPDQAYEHARSRSLDIAQPRPECGHATNAVCLVGRRHTHRGLYLDRRAFLVSYDPTLDETGDVLRALLLSIGPVGAGINLEYYFSFVDPKGYGCSTKLPHNVSGLVGVMDGHASDLRTGLPWQMVELHEPVRMLTIIEAPLDRVRAIVAREPALQQLVGNGWIRVAVWEPDTTRIYEFRNGDFHLYEPSGTDVPIVDFSVDHYRGRRDHLSPAIARAAFATTGGAGAGR